MVVFYSRIYMGTHQMAQPDLSTISLRELRCAINQHMANEADFCAFCLDYFPKIYQRMTPGMERQQKLTLLLELAPRQDLALALAQATTPAEAVPASRPANSISHRRWFHAAIAVTSLLLFMTFFVCYKRHLDSSLRVLGNPANSLSKSDAPSGISRASPQAQGPATSATIMRSSGSVNLFDMSSSSEHSATPLVY